VETRDGFCIISALTVGGAGALGVHSVGRFREPRKDKAVEFLVWLENSGLGVWVRESPSVWGYSGLISFHAFGLAFVVGLSWMIALQVLGFAPGLPVAPMEKVFPVIWIAFWVNAVSGIVLLTGSATKDLTNPVFLTKMAFVVLGIATVRWLKNEVFRDRASMDTTPGERRGTMDKPGHHAGAYRGRTNLDMTDVAVLDPPVAVLDATPVQTLDLPLTTKAKILAAASLACWAGAIVAGRLVEYPVLFGR